MVDEAEAERLDSQDALTGLVSISGLCELIRLREEALQLDSLSKKKIKDLLRLGYFLKSNSI